MENGQIDKPTDIHSRSDFIFGFLSTPGERRDKMGKQGGKKKKKIGSNVIYKKIGS